MAFSPAERLTENISLKSWGSAHPCQRGSSQIGIRRVDQALETRGFIVYPDSKEEVKSS